MVIVRYRKSLRLARYRTSLWLSVFGLTSRARLMISVLMLKVRLRVCFRCSTIRAMIVGSILCGRSRYRLCQEPGLFRIYVRRVVRIIIFVLCLSLITLCRAFSLALVAVVGMMGRRSFLVDWIRSVLVLVRVLIVYRLFVRLRARILGTLA